MLKSRGLGLLAAAAIVLTPALSTAEEGGGGGRPVVPSRFLASPQQVVAIRAGKLFDAVRGVMLSDQVILIRGDRIIEVGSGLPIPPQARVIDMSRMVVMPGLIDAHVHVNTGGASLPQRTLIAANSAQADLYAGFTTILDMDSRGGFATVDLRDAINEGLIEGPRMQVVGQSLNNRASGYVTDATGGATYSGRAENKDINGPWLARAAVREAKLHGVDYVKIYISQDFVGPNYIWNADGKLNIFQSLTLEEVTAIVDEAHRLGLKVACHSYFGNASDPCIVAGVDAPNHLLQLDLPAVKALLAKDLPFVPTVDDLVALEPGDLAHTGGRNSRLKMLEAAVRLAVANKVRIAFGSGATSPVHIPHGRQADQFAYYVRWGMTPVQALQTSYLGAAKVLNHGWDRQIGSIEPGKFADIIAVRGDPLADVHEMERVSFVMKGGVVVRDDVDPVGPH